jgi:hypothetical protein
MFVTLGVFGCDKWVSEHRARPLISLCVQLFSRDFKAKVEKRNGVPFDFTFPC